MPEANPICAIELAQVMIAAMPPPAAANGSALGAVAFAVPQLARRSANVDANWTSAMSFLIDTFSSKGRFKSIENAQFSRLGNAVVVRKMDGEFVSFLQASKGGQALNLPPGL
jgi:hypothetical protein